MKSLIFSALRISRDLNRISSIGNLAIAILRMEETDTITIIIVIIDVVMIMIDAAATMMTMTTIVMKDTQIREIKKNPDHLMIMIRIIRTTNIIIHDLALVLQIDTLAQSTNNHISAIKINKIRDALRNLIKEIIITIITTIILKEDMVKY